MKLNKQEKILKEFLDEKTDYYNNPEFITSDPIAIPHAFSCQNDIEIAAFMAATIAWGQRPMILKGAKRMMEIMENEPFEFIKNATPTDIKKLPKFIYRTFQHDDFIYFLHALQNLLHRYGSLGDCFKSHFEKTENIYDMLANFRTDFFSYEDPGRTSKHISNTHVGSAAKRLNMFLRWMVRKDNRGVDFGLWKFIPPSSLYLPLDVHTARVGRSLALLERKSNDWKAVHEITEKLKIFDPSDPVKYDFALFGLGIFEKF